MVGGRPAKFMQTGDHCRRIRGTHNSAVGVGWGDVQYEDEETVRGQDDQCKYFWLRPTSSVSVAITITLNNSLPLSTS